MLSPLGRTAETRECECVMLTCAWRGRPGVAVRAEGFFGRSTMVRSVGLSARNEGFEAQMEKEREVMLGN